MPPILRFLILALLALAPGLAALAREPSADDVTSAISDTLASEEPLVVEGVTLDVQPLRDLYAEGNGAPLWRGKEAAVADVLRNSAAEGLDPARYHPEAIAARRAAESASDAASRDLLLSAEMLRYAYDVRYGRARPTGLTADVAVGAPPRDAVFLVRWVAQSPDASAALAELPPHHPAYRALRLELARLSGALVDGKRWPLVPDGAKLKPGASDPSVPALRERLAATGELPPEAVNGSKVYDNPVVEAVKAFQARHALAPDGVVGPRVRAALNVGLATRVEQVIVNMERWRWLPEDLGPRYVLVNVAAARLTLIEDGEEPLGMPVIVGETDKTTPMFSSEITYVIFNPPWRVPDKIARRELLPKVQRDGAYFARQGIRLVGGWQPTPSEEDPEKVSWGGARQAAGFRLRQDPGPANPLGRVKFHIPNVFGVYLHDTPNKNLFAKEPRTLSHGCVRVGNALTLAGRVLEDNTDWSEVRREKILSSWRTVPVAVAKPIPVHLLYETAWVDDDGFLNFADDVYGRDRRLADRLQGRPEQQVASPRLAQP